MDKVFYFKELTEILNLLIPIIPENNDFVLYEIAKQNSIRHADLFTDGLINVEQTFINISNGLIVNNLARLVNDSKIQLTDQGKVLKKRKTWENYVDFIELQDKAEIAGLKAKAYWIKTEAIKTIVIVIITSILTIIIQWLTKKMGL